MKLYTEEQVREAINYAYVCCDELQIESAFDDLTPIELPSVEEIKDESMKHYDNNGADYYFEIGAKWMRDKIQGGNKQQNKKI